MEEAGVLRCWRDKVNLIELLVTMRGAGLELARLLENRVEGGGAVLSFTNCGLTARAHHWLMMIANRITEQLQDGDQPNGDPSDVQGLRH